MQKTLVKYMIGFSIGIDVFIQSSKISFEIMKSYCQYFNTSYNHINSFIIGEHQIPFHLCSIEKDNPYNNLKWCFS